MPYRTPSHLEICLFILKWKLKEMFAMPKRPKTPCSHPGCPALVEYGQRYCPDHKPLHPEATRSAGKRGYGTRWQNASRAYLVSHPLCVKCLAKSPPQYTKATVVDHIKPHRGDQTLFWDRDNWQPLCKACHDKKTLTEDINPTYTF